ncbi:DUF488 domain-containing protein [Desulfuromonas sp. DDH964]|uniref:DUF488 domain-containing protein n=1 Tax=Desulfuromonas sp. DDH964 TaxID=1823759 RepID=UPI00082EFE65|nr:DUF488 domain-containing protein [Desulfuromonas sp. DDH964]
MEIAVKRAYEEPSAKDGRRILVDRIWPRGRSKEVMQLDAWLKEVAPSDELRKWFGHEPEKWPEFKRRYFAELDDHPEAVAELRGLLGRGRVTLVFGARDEAHNNAVALKEYLERG